jgi:shikimate dehydrogenase
VDALRANGRLYFLDRSPELLIPTESRPLSSDKDAMIKRYNERYSRYCEVADEHIDGDGTPSEVADKIRK